MAISIEKEDNHCSMRIDGDMTIYTALDQKQEILQVIRECIDDEIKATEIDLSQVDDFDTAGLQILLLVHKEAAANNHKVYLGALSKVVTEVLDLYNIKSVFANH